MLDFVEVFPPTLECSLTKSFLVRVEEVSAAGHFEMEGYEDKQIEHIAAVEDDNRTILIGAMGRANYLYINAWDLREPYILWPAVIVDDAVLTAVSGGAPWFTV